MTTTSAGPTPPSNSPRLQFARVLRERFLAELDQTMVDIGAVVQERLTQLLDEPASTPETQERRDAWTAYKKARPLWQDATQKAWRAGLEQQPKKSASKLDLDGLQLVSPDAVESRILASRMAMLIRDKVNQAFDDLRIRLLFLQNIDELPENDVVRPEVLVLAIVEQWTSVGMASAIWPKVGDGVQQLLAQRLLAAYTNANEALVSKGVLPTIEPKDRRVKAPGRTGGASPAAARADTPQPAKVDPPKQQRRPPPRDPESGPASVLPDETPLPGAAGQHAPPASSGAMPFWRQTSGSGAEQGLRQVAADETRMMTVVSPLARAKSRAQGVFNQLRRLFSSQAGTDLGSETTQHMPPSPALAAALAPPPAAQPGQAAAMAASYAPTLYEDYSPAGVARVASDLRTQSAALKQKAETKNEKATIEIVALMFQAILAEERIPPGIRVWFARLQMPVLRVALEDPEFLASATHPARLLIDRMGSCVLGFDASGVQAKVMEQEIKRIVQVIEQYPETGKKVYQIVYEEFQRYLSKHLTEKPSTQKVVSVAQQVEQKDALAIQYTIELRNMLKDMPVHDEIRQFLFKVWSEVLAVAAVRQGSQDSQTLSLKKLAADLVWAASAKPNRADRARVLQDLPNLLQRLRAGMGLLALEPSQQDAYTKTINDVLAEAFMARTQVISQDKIDAMAERLHHLEDFVSDEGGGDVPLDTESLEMMLGLDASDLEVVANGGSKPTPAMLAWAQELQVGSWFTLDHNGQISQVQFVWRSDRRHLHLFASTIGKSFLIQAARLAAYLQAGLLLPQEEEALTVRATRDALTKLEANPERLFA